MKPNILVITSDQQRADCFGFENPQVRTPHLDNLARSGTRFSACITPNLVCQPSRASILTGLLPLTHGVSDNGIDLRPEVGADGFSGRLARKGYATAFIGKAHFSTKTTFKPTGTAECRFSTDLYESGWAGPYMGFQHVELATLGKLYPSRALERPTIGHWERWLLDQADDADKLWRASEGAGSGAAQTWNSLLPVAWHNSSWTADRAISWLEKQRQEAAPFCLWVSFADPHHPFDCPSPWNRLYDPEDIVLPKYRELDLDRRPWWHRASLESEPLVSDPAMRKFRASTSRVPKQDDRQLAEMTANYYGMISLIDHNVGRILSALNAAGLDENTLVVYTTDHGDMLGNHGLYLKGPTPYEDLLRVQLIAAGPDVAKGSVVEEPVSTLDLAPTFLEIADQEKASDMQGTSLVRLMSGKPEKREAAYSEWNVHPSRCGVALQLRTVRTSRYKCTFELVSGDGELYDLQEDPHEMENRFHHPEYQSIRARLHELMLARPGPVLESFDEPVGMA